MTVLAKGGNTPLTASTYQVALGWMPGAGAPDVDLSLLLVGADGKVRSDADMVFYNAPRHASGSVTHTGKTGATSGSATDTAAVDLGRVESDVEKVVLAASADGQPFGRVPGLHLCILDADGREVARFEDMRATTETAFVTGEFYRRAGAWKFRAVGQGWASGLAGLATDYGISVEESPTTSAPPGPTSSRPSRAHRGLVAPTPPAPTPPAPTPPAPTPPATTPPAMTRSAPLPAAAPSAPAAARGALVNLDKGRVSLVKGQKVSLTKSGAPPLTRVTMGLGWDPARGGSDIDLDASVIVFDAAGTKLEFVWFTSLRAYGDAILHAGDNLTGAGEGDDEQIAVDLDRLPKQVDSLVFTITSFRGHKFTEVKNAFCRLVDARGGQELVRFDLTDSEPHTGVIMAALRRSHAGTWVMEAIGEYHDGRTVRSLVDPASQRLYGR